MIPCASSSVETAAVHARQGHPDPDRRRGDLAVRRRDDLVSSSNPREPGAAEPDAQDPGASADAIPYADTSIEPAPAPTGRPNPDAPSTTAGKRQATVKRQATGKRPATGKPRA